MTVMAAEAAPAIAGEATGAATADTAASSRGLRPSRGKPPKQAAPVPEERSRRQKTQKFAKDYVSKSKKIERTNYQPIILMEFVACILLTAITPIATKKDEQGLSPYAGKDIVKLSAITVLYLILAMVSVGGPKPGRFAAWFGGLILLADGLYEAGNIVQDLRLVSGAGAAVPAPAAAAPGPGPGGILPTPSGTQPVLGEVPGG